MNNNDNLNTLFCGYDTSDTKFFLHSKLAINSEAFVQINDCEKRGNKFLDVIFNFNGKEFFLGRFNKTFDKLSVKYKDGKIIIFYEEISKQTNQMEIVEILSLYEIIDDMFYSCTQKEALELFDKLIDSSHLKNPYKKIYRSDVEKKLRLK